MKQILSLIACLLLMLAPMAFSQEAQPALFKSTWLHLQEKPILADFRLVDTQDQLFDRDRLKGKWSFLFFGYTQCPDICPTTLSSLANALRITGDSMPIDNLQIVFVTVDPDRDTAEVIKSYVRYFHPGILGVRGPLSEIRKLSSALQMFHYIARSEDGGRYTVSHSGDIAIINPAGLHVGMISPPFNAQSIAADLQLLLTNR